MMVVVNLRNGAVTEYGIAANAVCPVGGRLFVATGDGLFLLDGESDGGKPVDASVTLPDADLGSSYQKRIAEVYADVRNTGPDALVLGVAANGESYQYEMRGKGSVNNGSPLKCRPGRGLRSRRFQLSISNRAGAGFVLLGLSALIEQAETRRV